MKRDQELIDQIGINLGLSKDEYSDDIIWEKTKNSYMAACISLGISIEQFKKEITALINSILCDRRPLEDAPNTGELVSNCVECSGPNGFHYALCSKSDTGEEG